jgi:hypothetical protein
MRFHILNLMEWLFGSMRGSRSISSRKRELKGGRES